MVILRKLPFSAMYQHRVETIGFWQKQGFTLLFERIRKENSVYLQKNERRSYSAEYARILSSKKENV